MPQSNKTKKTRSSSKPKVRTIIRYVEKEKEEPIIVIPGYEKITLFIGIALLAFTFLFTLISLFAAAAVMFILAIVFSVAASICLIIGTLKNVISNGGSGFGAAAGIITAILLIVGLFVAAFVMAIISMVLSILGIIGTVYTCTQN